MTWQESRTWADTGATLRVRKSGVVKIRDIDTEIKKALIEEATDTLKILPPAQVMGRVVELFGQGAPRKNRPFFVINTTIEL